MSLFSTTKLHQLFSSFRPHERVLVWILFIGLSIGTIGLLSTLQTQVSTKVPVQGGTYTEGIIGFARYVNPVLANTNQDKDLTQLVYDGLMRRNANGEIVPDIATEMSVSNKRRTYTFTIDPAAKFHDGHPVRAEDVVFTINAIQNPEIDSPKRAQWQNVAVQAVNETTVRFQLPENFAGFPANATVGILPKHLWQDESGQSFPFSKLNTRPVGAGPYEVVGVKRNANGVPTTFKLKASPQHADKKPNITHLIIRSFPDSQTRRNAYKQGRIDGMPNVDPAYAQQLKQNDKRVTAHQFNRVFSVFFNDNQNEALVSQSVREALSKSIPKATIVNSALAGFGQTVSGPLPPALALNSQSSTTSSTPADLLTDAGWTLADGKRTQDGETLAINLTTVDIPALRKTANIIAEKWRNLGVSVTVQTLPTAELTQNVIRPRDFEALLFGQSFSSRRDLYSFWHSSRQEDPGLNFAQYANNSVDNSLEALRSATSSQQVAALTNSVVTEIKQDQPAAFIFSPSFIYVLPEHIGNVRIPPVIQPADRFTTVTDWYTDTDMLWNVFVDQRDQK